MLKILFNHASLKELIMHSRPIILKLISCSSDRIGIWKCWFFRREENGKETREKPSEQDENRQQTQPTYGTGSESNPGGGRALSPLHHCTTPAPMALFVFFSVHPFNFYSFLLFSRSFVKTTKALTSLSLSRRARFWLNSSLACHVATIVTALVLRFLVFVAVYIHRALMSDWYRAACIPRHWRTFTIILH